MKQILLKLCGALAAVLLIGSLVGCESSDDVVVNDGRPKNTTSAVQTTEAVQTQEPLLIVPLTEVGEQELAALGLSSQEQDYPWNYAEYSGICGDCVVYMHPGATRALAGFRVAGYKFGFNTGFMVFAYHNGEEMRLEDAYQRGLLTAEQVADISRYHAEYLINRYGEENFEFVYGRLFGSVKAPEVDTE